MGTACVYALIDPRTLEIKYIGITKRNTKVRLLDHIRIAKNETDTNIHKRAWIRQLLELGLEPKIVILETCPIEDLSNSEIWWIALCKRLGFNLTNLTEGGDFPPGWDGRTHTEETKQKQSRAIGAYYKKNDHPSKGKKLSPEHIENMIKTKKKKGIYRKNWKGFVSEEEARVIYQRRSDNEEWRKNLSLAAQKRFSDPIKNVMYGKKQSDESNEKNRLSNMIYAAYKKGDYQLVAELQEDYQSLSGHYQADYTEFCYQ